jgi:hypothetical protein
VLDKSGSATSFTAVLTRGADPARLAASPKLRDNECAGFSGPTMCEKGYTDVPPVAQIKRVFVELV